MIITEIKAFTFRNYENLILNFNPEKKYNVIYAPNGMGKTNLLEIIYFLSHLRSFRKVNDNDLVKKENRGYFIKAEIRKNNIFNSISVKYDKKKEIFLNEKKVTKYSEVLGFLLTVFFGNDDIFLINGSTSIRRNYFDLFFSILNSGYLILLKKYNEILKQKNITLKTDKNIKLINIYNFQMADIICELQIMRKNYISNISEIFKKYFKEIGNYHEEVDLIYSPSIKINNDNILGEELKEKILKILNENIFKEIKIGYSFYGLHKDNYFYLINKSPFLKYASFGQTRLAGFIIKLVQAEFYKKVYNNNPILLLDDVILEMDKKKQERVLNFIEGYDQIFMTFTDKEYLDLISNKTLINEIKIENGKIQ